MGTRELKNSFSYAFTDEKTIKLRQEFVELFIKDTTILSSIEDSLENIRDIDRILTKISTKKYIPQLTSPDWENFMR